MSKASIRFEFNYASLQLVPYKGESGGSNQLLKRIIKKLMEPDFPSDKRVKDRHKNRTNTMPRRIVVISKRYERESRRYFGKVYVFK